MKNLLKLIVISSLALTIIGCSSGGAENEATVNNDVKSGTPPPGLSGSEGAGQPAASTSTDTVSSTP